MEMSDVQVGATVRCFIQGFGANGLVGKIVNVGDDYVFDVEFEGFTRGHSGGALDGSYSHLWCTCLDCELVYPPSRVIRNL